MQLSDETKNIGNVLDDVSTNDFFELIVVEGVREAAEIVNDVGVTSRVRIDADRAGIFVLSTANIKNLFLCCAVDHC